ncbi:hypothetical protein PFICI_11906 [Pestalotiopsis fici W106-1]|uniref:VPS9 domain-containing protein n=1 Tax=Pestalotiopsis fici (strain W106-1 / CGMCC3.15140) TaxID=1229662 RepID=W3WRQ7_PESFW|nr:uncharacterized protein PFICI_11906 [Pestalotiopsis fici W106-1]ETS76519.1 hypothetical protein PFICI_11906 [Pestalotiopsis fici W106-1]
MASKATEPKHGLRTSRSFTRQESQPPEPLTRTQRANTFQNGSTKPTSRAEPDAFETPESDDPIEPPRASVDMDDIPIELVSKIDNFIDSLSAKVHAAPPNIDDISRRFQDFYNTAAQLIQTHISSLSTIQNRSSPRPSVTTRPSAASILRAKAAALGSKEKAKAPEVDQQMLTPDELANRKRARKALEHKRLLLEEAVERRLCEGIYDRIYRHRTTQDEAQDDKLRSKTAALSVVGIGPTDLGVDIGELPEDNIAAVAKKQEEISQSLEQARKDLTLMTEKRYPLGKLNYLKATHKSIVDTLSHFHPSSSADEIMPMLIYTLITMPPEKLHVVSDSKFIERFRWEEKLDGEAAYCLTNLEAAINFLETVDLASLRASEALSGPPKRENSPDITKTETFPPAYTAGISATSSTPAIVTPASASGLKAPPSPTSARAAAQRRRLSDLIQTPAQAIGSARDSFFDTADQGIKNITNSLGDSYKFWLGKIREDSKELVVPKTLEDARKLIGTPPPDDDDPADTSRSSRRGAEHDAQTLGREDRMLSLVGGRKASVASRDRSADSTRSASSSKKVAFSAEDNKEKAASSAANPMISSSPINPSLVEQARNLGNSLNPMNKFSGMIRPFGRSVTTPVQASTPPPKDSAGKPVDGGDLATAFPDIAAALPPKEVKIPQIKPPNKRFIELQNPADLKLGEVLELLRDYRRLAGALKDMGAFKET